MTGFYRLLGVKVGLAERLINIDPTVPGLPCGVKKVLQQLSGADRQALQNIMDMRSYPIGVSNRQIHAILLDEGYDIAFASVRLHRSKQCRCYVGKYSEKRMMISATTAADVELVTSTPKKKVASRKPKTKSKPKPKTKPKAKTKTTKGR